MKNKNKKNKAETKISNEEKILVMLESMQDSIKIIAEGQIALEEKLTRNINEFKKEMYEFRVETGNNFKAVFDFEFNFSEEVRKENSKLKKALNKKIDNVKRNKVDRSEFKIMQKKFMKMAGHKI